MPNHIEYILQLLATQYDPIEHSDKNYYSSCGIILDIVPIVG
jgi:hypothetical protein